MAVALIKSSLTINTKLNTHYHGSEVFKNFFVYFTKKNFFSLVGVSEKLVLMSISVVFTSGWCLPGELYCPS